MSSAIADGRQTQLKAPPPPQQDGRAAAACGDPPPGRAVFHFFSVVAVNAVMVASCNDGTL